MFLRATRVQTPPDKVEQAIENFKTNTVKSLRAAPGNQGAVLLVNRQTGAGLGITYWESAKALAANEQTGIQARTQTLKSVPGTQIINVERAELMIMDRTEAPKAGTFVRSVTVNGDPDKLDAGIVSIRRPNRAALEWSSQSSRVDTASSLNPPIVSNASRRNSALVLPKQLVKAPVAASPPRNGRRECSRRLSDEPFDVFVDRTACEPDCVSDEIDALETLGEGEVEWRCDVEDRVPPVLARGDELHEVLLNLFENARLAGARHVRAVVRTTILPDGAAAVTIEVIDDGSGIPEDVLPRIFEPHFSTRTSGSGLGLAITRRLVESWGGEVEIESEVGAGTRVTVSLRAN